MSAGEEIGSAPAASAAPVAAAAGRADLFRALDRDGDAGLAAIAGLLGYEARAGRKRRPAEPVEPRAVTAAGADPETGAATAGFQPLPFWRPVAAELSSEDELGRQLAPPEERPVGEPEEQDFTAPEDAARPAPAPIVAWPRLWRALDDRLRTTVPRAEIDVRELVARWARGESVERLPRLRGLAHATLVVVLDYSPALLPLRFDQLGLGSELLRRLGPATARMVVVRGAESEPFRAAKGERVLALTDLGGYGTGRRAVFWERLGERLRRSGVAARALVPCPPSLWPRRAAELWSAVEWSAPARRSALPRRRPARGATVGRAPAAEPDPVETLLRLASPAIRLEAGLVRDLRRLVPGAGVEVEVELWRHGAVATSSMRGLSLGRNEARRRLAQFRQLPEASQRAVIAALAAWHGAQAPEIWAEEVLGLLACGVPAAWLGADVVERAVELFEKLCMLVARGGEAELAGDAESYFERFRGRASRPLWSHPRLRRPLARAEEALRRRRRRGDSEPLAGATPEMFIPSAEDVERWVAWQEGSNLRIRRAGEAGEGSPLATISARQPKLLAGDGVAPDRVLDLAGEPPRLPVPRGGRPIELVSDVEAVRLELWQPPEWASAAGRDEHGLWAAFEVGGARQRMRWIPPGRFQMGSPDSEPGRYPDEGPRHWVVLTEGFWLAETPCTQEVWEAVMGAGENPSHFKAGDRPVERVSWDDCQRFVDRLNFTARGLEVRLPAEAEWEYACRAETETPYWSGSDESALERAAWYVKNSEGRTHAVGQKPSNPWGLHDMLGNVYEWCREPSSSYQPGVAIDPEGPEEGAMRVIRGGSWGAPARGVRAAYRRGILPDRRYSTLGFRLSRGRRLQGQEAERPAAGSERAGRGTSPRRRSRRDLAWVERLGWATDGGADRYGRWASFEIDGVKQRMRWIVPGCFVMGSPESEAGRWRHEGPRHEVTLTEGFWLGATLCTQALWQAVMGENPSHFRSSRRPVEQLSWEDCQEFFERLKARLPELAAGFPTEAQWEYACRAGTDTAIWLGDLEILGERDAPLLDEIAWYGGNSGVGYDLENGEDSSDWPEAQYPHSRAGTREVGLKRPNPWGLYDMLGNVWEWCSDWWHDAYPEGPRVDPRGPEQGPSHVIRGGSWFTPSRYVRSAVRHVRSDARSADSPGDSDDNLGFRLSLGQTAPVLTQPSASQALRAHEM